MTQVILGYDVGKSSALQGVVDIRKGVTTEAHVHCLIRRPIGRERRQRGECMGGGG